MSRTVRAVGRSTGHMPSPSGLKLFNHMVTVWYRGKAKVNRLLGAAPPKTPTTHESTCRFPYEVVEMIIAHLTWDLDTLKACSLACRSWYTAAVPHIHHTLILRNYFTVRTSRGLKPLFKLHKQGLSPLVREMRVRKCEDTNTWFAPRAFDPPSLGYFSAFVNVHTLNLQSPAIYLFIPDIKQYFGHFSPTLRSIFLSDSVCIDPRELSYFLSLFPNLDDIEIWGLSTPNVPTPDAELVPFSAPKLQGRLRLHGFCWVETWTYLITSCNGLRFRDMDLRMVAGCAPVLLEACANTLETLRFYVMDGPELHPFSMPELDLSGLKVLRSLELGACIPGFRVAGTLHATAIEVFSTITSLMFSEIVVVLGHDEIARLPSDAALVETLSAMHKIRPFKLVFLLMVSDRLRGVGRRELVEALDSVTSKGSLDFLDSPPTICVRRWDTRH